MYEAIGTHDIYEEFQKVHNDFGASDVYYKISDRYLSNNMVTDMITATQTIDKVTGDSKQLKGMSQWAAELYLPDLLHQMEAMIDGFLLYTTPTMLGDSPGDKQDKEKIRLCMKTQTQTDLFLIGSLLIILPIIIGLPLCHSYAHNSRTNNVSQS